jgi:hypothetical protein
MASITATTTPAQLPSGAFTIRNEGAVDCRLGNTSADAAVDQGMKLAAGEVYPHSGAQPLWIRSASSTCDVRLLY